MDARNGYASSVRDEYTPPRRLLGPDGLPITSEKWGRDGYPLPHVLQMGAIIQSGYEVFWDRWDEARRHSRENALAMEKDCFLQSLLQERALATATLKWHVHCDNERDPYQKALKDGMQRVLAATPHRTRMNYEILKGGLWYGRTANQRVYEWREISVPVVKAMPVEPGISPPGGSFRPAPDKSSLPGGLSGGLPGAPGAVPAAVTTTEERRRSLCVRQHQPVHGDSILHKFDGTPVIMMYPPAADTLAGAQTTYSPISKAVVLTGTWRERFVVYSHESKPAEFFDYEKAEAIHGSGLRDVAYWSWWMKTEYLEWFTTFFERFGLGLRLWGYEAGNSASYDEVFALATAASRRVNVLVPIFGGKSGQQQVGGLTSIETPIQGADAIRVMLEYFDAQMERYFVGQSMSGGADSESGLGGTGRAKFVANTKYQLVKYDAENLADCYTSDWLRPVQRWTYPECRDIPLEYRLNVPDPDNAEKLAGVQACVSFGVDFKKDEVRALTGMSDPQPGDDIVGGAEQLAAELAADVAAADVPGEGPKEPPGGGKNEGGGEPPRGVPTTTDAGPKSLRPEPPGPPSVARHRKERDAGQWITIGGTKGADGKRHGGTPVCVVNGRITKGAPSLVGKSIDALKEEGEEGTHRQQLARGKEYGRASWAKKARAEGVKPEHLHQLAAEMLAHDKEYKGELTKMLQHARKDLKSMGYDARALGTNLRSGHVEDDIPGIDVAAADMASMYPEFFHGEEGKTGGLEGKLIDYLKAGNPEPMSEDEAYEQALEHLHREKESGGDTSFDFGAGTDEPLPFLRSRHTKEPDASPEGKDRNLLSRMVRQVGRMIGLVERHVTPAGPPSGPSASPAAEPFRQGWVSPQGAHHPIESGTHEEWAAAHVAKMGIGARLGRTLSGLEAHDYLHKAGWLRVGNYHGTPYLSAGSLKNAAARSSVIEHLSTLHPQQKIQMNSLDDLGFRPSTAEEALNMLNEQYVRSGPVDRHVTDAQGHEHKPSGTPDGGQFTGQGGKATPKARAGQISALLDSGKDAEALAHFRSLPTALANRVMSHLDDHARRGLEAASAGEDAAPAKAPAPGGFPEEWADAPAFAAAVGKAASETKTGGFGDNKVFVAHVWRTAQKQHPGLSLDAFKAGLLRLNQARLLNLSRADFVQAMNPEDVEESEIRHLNATFHFILSPGERRQTAPDAEAQRRVDARILGKPAPGKERD